MLGPAVDDAIGPNFTVDEILELFLNAVAQQNVLRIVRRTDVVQSFTAETLQSHRANSKGY